MEAFSELVDPAHFEQVYDSVQRTCVDKILALGECPPKDLKIGEEWGPEVLNLRLFFLFV